MTNPRWQRLLMVITILGIAGFLTYWLIQNYAREKRSLAIRTELCFRETIQELQVEKLKLDGIPVDSMLKKRVNLVVGSNLDETENINVHLLPGHEIISTINVLRDKLKDSLKSPANKKGRMIISMNQTTTSFTGDSGITSIQQPGIPGRSQLVNVLYGVDSLQDSLRLPDITMAFGNELKKQQLNVPFTIERSDSGYITGIPVFNEVTVGFAKPVTYSLHLGNTIGFLLKQLLLPIVFSLLLLGITILSFVLLYKNLLRQRRLTAIKNEFIGNITHELKTPISTVSVAIEAMRNFNALKDPDRTDEYLSIAGQELGRLSLLVDKVLRLSMFETQQLTLSVQQFDLAEMLKEVLNTMQLQFEKCGALVTISYLGIDFVLSADRMHLMSVIYNLLDNALKYAKETPVIHIETKATADKIEIRIRDNGIGIRPEYQDKIFEKFFRVPHGNTHNVKGYGLGLSYAAYIIERHKGDLQVESNGTGGTTFIIILPRSNGN